MATVYRSPLAEEYYRHVWRYFAVDNPVAADRLLQRMDAKLDLYARNPGMGQQRERLGLALRSFSGRCLPRFLPCSH